jgi:hypothetical protein
MESSLDRLKRRVKEVGLTKLEPWELQYLLEYLKDKNFLERMCESIKNNPVPLPPLKVPEPKRSWLRRLLDRVW